MPPSTSPPVPRAFPKAILHNHERLMQCLPGWSRSITRTTRDDVLPVHSAPVPYRRKNALVRQPDFRLQGGAAEGHHPRVPYSRRFEGALHHCMAAGALGTGSFGCRLDRGDIQSRGLRYLDQWRLMHIGAQPVPPSMIQRWLILLPQSPVRHQLRPVRIHRSRLRPPGQWKTSHKVGAIGEPGYGWQCTNSWPRTVPVRSPRAMWASCRVKGPGVMACYYNDPEATAQVLTPGRLAEHRRYGHAGCRRLLSTWWTGRRT